MTQLKQNKIIPLDRYLDLNLIDSEKTVYGIVSNIHPSSPNQVIFRKIYDTQNCSIPKQTFNHGY